MHDMRREALEMAIAYAGKASSVDVMAIAEQFHAFLVADVASPPTVASSPTSDASSVASMPVASVPDAVVPAPTPVPVPDSAADVLTSPLPVETPPAPQPPPPVAPVVEAPAPAQEPTVS